MITVDCRDLVSDFESRVESGESLNSIFADLEYGFMAELEDVARRLLVCLSETMETTMVDTTTNGLSASLQQASSSQ